MIPTYAAEGGKRTRSFTLAAIQRMEEKNLVYVRRNRKGVVTRAHFRTPDGGNPLASVCRMGQKYSAITGSETARWWEFREFLNHADRTWLRENVSKEEAERTLVSIFRAVSLSCITK